MDLGGLSVKPATKLQIKELEMLPLDILNNDEVEWLLYFIHAHHSVPKFMLPHKEDLKNPNYRYFKAVATAPENISSKTIGISSYEIRTPYLAETQKTIIAPEFRGGGWGRILSLAIEE